MVNPMPEGGKQWGVGWGGGLHREAGGSVASTRRLGVRQIDGSWQETKHTRQNYSTYKG